jgi:hypothetical protein
VAVPCGGLCRSSLRWALVWALGVSVMTPTAAQVLPRHPPPAEEDLVPLVPKRPRHKDAPAPAPRQAPGRLRALPVPDDAVGQALADVLTLAPYARPYARYIRVREGTLEADADGKPLSPPALSRDGKAVALTLGMASRSVFPNVRPVPVPGGQVLRIDLTQYAPRPGDLREWLRLWEEFRFDPDFNLLLTRDELEMAARYGVDAGKGEKVDVDVVRIDGPHIDPAALYRLKKETHSEAPVVGDRYLAYRVLRTVKDRGVYRVIWGGLYYDLRGVRRVKDLDGRRRKEADAVKATDLDILLDAAGIGNIRAGLTYDRLFERLRSDQRVAVFKSGVTGKPREVEWFHGPDSRDGTGAFSITHDLANKDVDIGTHPLYNLEYIRAAAYEVIGEGTNGFPVYAIYDGDQKLLDVADATQVVADRTVPDPFPPALQCGDSCLACHCAQGDVGWKPLRNDAKRMLSGRLDVFGDLSQRDPFGPRTIERLAGLYAGNFDKHIRRARDDLDETVLRCAGPWPGVKDQVNAAKPAFSHVVDRCRGYFYGEVTPDVALEELGLKAPKGKAVAVLKALLPPDPEAAVVLPYTQPYVAENPVLGALKEGLAVSRSDWDLVKSFAALRSRKTLAALRGAGRD